ncbi:MAG: hypothetical protein ABR975_06870 [Vulcanimicrobiaceae bacterium]
MITDVPASVYHSNEGNEEIVYAINVAERLDELVAIELASAAPGVPRFRSYGEVTPEADFALKFTSPDANVPNPTLQTWRRVMDKAYTAFKIAVKSLDSKPGSASYPQVVYFARSSIVLGVRASGQAQLFPFDFDASEAPEKALRLLMGASLWLDGLSQLPPDIAENSGVVESLLRAVEELSPVDEGATVTLERIGTDERAVFTRAKREIARKKRVEIRLSGSQDSRRIDIVGRIASIDEQGRAVLRGVAPHDLWHDKTATCSFEPDLLPALLENFGHQVCLSAIQPKEFGAWSRNLEAIDVVRFPGKTAE